MTMMARQLSVTVRGPHWGRYQWTTADVQVIELAKIGNHPSATKHPWEAASKPVIALVEDLTR